MIEDYYALWFSLFEALRPVLAYLVVPVIVVVLAATVAIGRDL